MQDGLRKVRKNLEIKTGSMKEVEQKKDTPKKGMGDVTKGPMFRKYFQSGDDDDDPSTASYDTVLTDAGVNPDELWSKVRGHDVSLWTLTAMQLHSTMVTFQLQYLQDPNQ